MRLGRSFGDKVEIVKFHTTPNRSERRMKRRGHNNKKATPGRCNYWTHNK